MRFLRLFRCYRMLPVFPETVLVGEFLRLNGHDAYTYLKEIPERLPTQATTKSPTYFRIAGPPSQ
jgi:hypothetical protein